MFDLILSGVQAFNQIGMFAGALVCLGFAGLILGSSLYTRVHAIRTPGKIIGVLNENGAYFPVYRYTTPDGQVHEAKSDTGSSSASGKETGREVSLMISAHNPGEASVAGDHLLGIIGVAFLIPGVWFGYTALTAYPVTRMTWIMASVFLVHTGERLWRIFIPKGPRISVAEWKKLHTPGDASVIDLSNVQPIETLATPGTPTVQWQNRRAAVPLLGLVTLALVALAAYESNRVFLFETGGQRTEGEVVRMIAESSSGGSGYTYYPVVRFRTADNRTIQFKDNLGSNPPTRHPGDKAAVLYLPGNPAQAMIDRGLINWLIPGLLFLGGALAARVLLRVVRPGKFA